MEITMKITIESFTDKSVEAIKTAITKGVYQGLDRECSRIALPANVKIEFLPEPTVPDTKSKMTNLKVVGFDSESLEFDNGIVLSSYHNQDCCESHYLSLSDLTMADFEGLEFDLSNDNFFERIEDYGIALKPIVGFPVRIPAYGYNNGYYSSDLTLTISNGKNLAKSFDITECQSISG